MAKSCVLLALSNGGFEQDPSEVRVSTIGYLVNDESLGTTTELTKEVGIYVYPGEPWHDVRCRLVAEAVDVFSDYNISSRDVVTCGW